MERIFVESGKMIVRVWQDADPKGLVDETVLNAGDYTTVKPESSQFEGVKTELLLNCTGRIQS